jgi:hypothetical protein
MNRGFVSNHQYPADSSIDIVAKNGTINGVFTTSGRYITDNLEEI